MKTKRSNYSIPNLKVDAVIILFICLLGVAQQAPIVNNPPVHSLVNPSK